MRRCNIHTLLVGLQLRNERLHETGEDLKWYGIINDCEQTSIPRRLERKIAYWGKRQRLYQRTYLELVVTRYILESHLENVQCASTSTSFFSYYILIFLFWYQGTEIRLWFRLLLYSIFNKPHAYSLVQCTGRRPSEVISRLQSPWTWPSSSPIPSSTSDSPSSHSWDPRDACWKISVMPGYFSLLI